MAPLQVLEEVRRLGGHEIETISEVDGNISAKDLEEVRRMLNQPPLVVQRTLEMTHLILNADRLSKNVTTPDWASVQRTLSDAEFHTRVLSYDVGMLRAAPGLCAYLVEEYLNPAVKSGSDTMPRRSSLTRRGSHRRSVSPSHKKEPLSFEPLTFERVRRANVAAASLFRWCVEAASHAAVANTTEAPEPEPMPEPIPEPAAPQPFALHLPRPALTRAITNDDSPSSARPRKSARQDKVAAPEGPKLEPFNRYFEVLVPFHSGRDLVAAEQVAHLRKVVDTLVMRPNLTLEVAACTNVRHGSIETDNQRIYSIGLFFASHGVTYTVEESEEYSGADAMGQAGVWCRIRLDRDAELRSFFSGHKDSADRDTRNAARWLADNFCMR
mmetsp:Transcript_75664/g.131109  ORF Transcript_75664/g.131109 Transcript_75664/m.131109 type:complete len:384 (-) Transcript_75664:229-1380(-)